jgi:siroheme synthase
MSSALLVVSGHDEAALAATVGQLPPNGITIVVLMGLGRSAAIASLLIDRGWPRGMPAAIVVDGTRAQQQVWRGRLDEVAADRAEITGEGAGTIVIGDVAALDLQAHSAAGDAGEAFEEQPFNPTVGGQHVGRR